MWNDLRDQNDQDQPYFQDDLTENAEEEEAPAKRRGGFNLGALTREPILGMTPAQRFVIATMLLMAVCILGAMFLLVTEKFVIF